MTAIATFTPTWYGDRLIDVTDLGVSPYGNRRYELHFASGHKLRTAPGFQMDRLINYLVDGDVEFTLDHQLRVNEIHPVTMYVAHTSRGTRWWTADSLHDALAMQNKAFPNDAVMTVRYAAEGPDMQAKLGKRQYAVLREMNGGTGIYLRRSERITVQQSLLKRGLLTRQDGKLILTPRGRTFLIWAR